MKFTAILSFAVLALSATGAMAQSGNTGTSGISGGIGSDFAAGNVPGDNEEDKGGYAKSLEEAFSGTGQGIGGTPSLVPPPGGAHGTGK